MSKDEKTLSLEERQLALQERLLAIQEMQLANQQAQTVVQQKQLKQTVKPSNAVSHGISDQNPRGEKDFPMAKLKCWIDFAYPIRPADHPLTREEVELFNLLQPGAYTIRLTDGRTIPVFVEERRNSISGAVELLSFFGPKDEKGNWTSLFDRTSPDRFRAMPPLTDMLRRMIGKPAEAVQSMDDEKAQIARELAEVEAGMRDIATVLSQGA